MVPRGAFSLLLIFPIFAAAANSPCIGNAATPTSPTVSVGESRTRKRLGRFASKVPPASRVKTRSESIFSQESRGDSRWPCRRYTSTFSGGQGFRASPENGGALLRQA